MKKQEYIKAIAVAVVCLFVATSCSESEDGAIAESGIQTISLSPTLEVVEGASDLTSLIYTDQSLIVFGWLTADGSLVVMGDDYRYNGLYWATNGGATYADQVSEHTLFGYVTGSDADCDNYKAIEYNYGDGDLLYTLATTTPQKEAVVTPLKHVVAQLSVEFQFEDFRKDEVVKFSIPYLYKSAVLNLTTTPAVYDTSSSDMMELNKSYTATADIVSASFSTLLLPQSISAINVSVYDSVTTITPDVPIELVAGERCSIVINVKKNPLVEVTMGSVSVKPWDYDSATDVTISDPIVIE
ncbi:MAG: fimbrillin family protein [Rikenellaceae bacterium]